MFVCLFVCFCVEDLNLLWILNHSNTKSKHLEALRILGVWAIGNALPVIHRTIIGQAASVIAMVTAESVTQVLMDFTVPLSVAPLQIKEGWGISGCKCHCDHLCRAFRRSCPFLQLYYRLILMTTQLFHLTAALVMNIWRQKTCSSCTVSRLYGLKVKWCDTL